MKNKNIYIITISLFLLLTTFNFISSSTISNNIPLNVSFPLPSEKEVFEVFECDRNNLYLGKDNVERENNYAFEGEQLQWIVLVVDLYGKEEIKKVYTTFGDAQKEGNNYYSSCNKILKNISQINFQSCNAHFGDYKLDGFDDNTMEYYNCELTVKSPEEIYGEKWITVEAKTHSGELSTIDENEFWFFNPTVALMINGEALSFGDLTTGKVSYSNNITLINSADERAGVILDMFISGTDFYDTKSQFSYCPDKNKLSLSRITYFASNGEYYTTFETPSADKEGYRKINYATSFNSTQFYGAYEIIPKDQIESTIYSGNLLNPSSEMILNFKVNVPETCVGTFDSGNIYFWAEAV